MKMKNEKRTVFRFENEKLRALKIPIKNLF